MCEKRGRSPFKDEIAKIATPYIAGAFVLELLDVCDGRRSQAIVLTRRLHAKSMRRDGFARYVVRTPMRWVGYDPVHVNAEFADQASDQDPQVAFYDIRGAG
jgi:hypothetical protein